MNILNRDFYKRSAEDVALELLGKVLNRKIRGKTISGMIVETEAYLPANDFASHAVRGKNKRTNSLYLDAGHAYVHQIHNHNCIDIVVESEDVPSGVLIRALEPIESMDLMRLFRRTEDRYRLTNGPGKLCQALDIDQRFDGIDITLPESPIYIVDVGKKVEDVGKSIRVGISKSAELELRFYIKNNPYVSKVRRNETK